MDLNGSCTPSSPPEPACKVQIQQGELLFQYLFIFIKKKISQKRFQLTKQLSYFTTRLVIYKLAGKMNSCGRLGRGVVDEKIVKHRRYRNENFRCKKKKIDKNMRNMRVYSEIRAYKWRKSFHLYKMAFFCVSALPYSFPCAANPPAAILSANTFTRFGKIHFVMLLHQQWRTIYMCVCFFSPGFGSTMDYFPVITGNGENENLRLPEPVEWITRK